METKTDPLSYFDFLLSHRVKRKAHYVFLARRKYCISKIQATKLFNQWLEIKGLV